MKERAQFTWRTFTTLTSTDLGAPMGAPRQVVTREVTEEQRHQTKAQ